MVYNLTAICLISYGRTIMDRRIKRTRSAVFNAMLDLLVEKESNKITVLELCQRADINKSTFYLHYKNIDDCLHKCFQTIMDGVIAITQQINYEDMKTNPKPIVDKLLAEVEDNIDYLIKFKGSDIAGRSIMILKQNIVQGICDSNNISLEDNYYDYCVITFMVAGCIDAVIAPLPIFDKEAISNSICTMIKIA